MDTKVCKTCNQELPITEFWKTGGCRTRASCKSCLKEDLYARNKVNFVKRQYGISLEKYEEIMNKATECEVCGSKENLVYDHCHDTGNFRGVLCSPCNRGMGLLGDTKESIQKVMEYLSK